MKIIRNNIVVRVAHLLRGITRTARCPGPAGARDLDFVPGLFGKTHQFGARGFRIGATVTQEGFAKKSDTVKSSKP
jgi:hypothetical protein